jgi:hypothetical protein
MVWAQFGTAVLGGAVGAVLTQAATFLRDWLNKREDGKFTALMLALALEDYASECTEPIFVLSNFVSSHHSTEEPSGSVPSLPVFAEKTNWRSIGVDHASSVLGFRVKVGTAHSALRDTWQFGGPASTWGSAADTAVELGAAALQIAGQLRAAFKLGLADRQRGLTLRRSSRIVSRTSKIAVNSLRRPSPDRRGNCRLRPVRTRERAARHSGDHHMLSKSG